MTIRVVIVDDSALSRAILTKVLEADGDIKIVGEATNGFEAVPRILAEKPDLVTMDVDMPGPNGLETIERVMHTCPVPILLVTGEQLGPESDIGFRAIQLGALDFMAKPPITDQDATAALRTQVRTLSRVPVFLHQDPRGLTSPPAPPEEKASRYSIVAIASGTGGPKSLATIARTLPADFGCSVVVVQHMPSRFTYAFSKYLEAESRLRVRLVDAMPHECMPGEIILCAGDAHLFFPRRGVIVGTDAPPYANHRPSATVLLRSMAEMYGREAIGVLLSGTGEDGLEGLDAVRVAGGLTLAESPDTALIRDLPQAAVDRGYAMRAMPAEMLADYIFAAASNTSSKTTAPPSNHEL